MNCGLKYKRLIVLLVLIGLSAFFLTESQIPAISISLTEGNPTVLAADPDDESLIFKGRVLSIDPSGRSFLVAVEKDYHQFLGDRAAVGLYADAAVTRADTGETISLKDVPLNSELTITITGGVRESYPVQVSAIAVAVNLSGCQTG